LYSIRARASEVARATGLLRQSLASHLDVGPGKLRRPEAEPAALSSRSSGQLARVATHHSAGSSVRGKEIPPTESPCVGFRFFLDRNRGGSLRAAAIPSE